MATTIQVSKQVKSALDKVKVFEKETYNEVLEWLMEDYAELTEETKKGLALAKAQIARGEFKTHEQVKKELSF